MFTFQWWHGEVFFRGTHQYQHIFNLILHLEPPYDITSSYISKYLIPPYLQIIYQSPQVTFENGIGLLIVCFIQIEYKICQYIFLKFKYLKSHGGGRGIYFSTYSKDFSMKVNGHRYLHGQTPEISPSRNVQSLSGFN